ncbi:MAG: hypothetical protein ACOYMV_05540 [Verrucomicrobiia bacterium]
MSEAQVIPPTDVAELARLYDGFAHALDPFAPERDAAEEAFCRALERLRCTHAPTQPMDVFRREAVRQCRLYLRKNPLPDPPKH